MRSRPLGDLACGVLGRSAPKPALAVLAVRSDAVQRRCPALQGDDRRRGSDGLARDGLELGQCRRSPRFAPPSKPATSRARTSRSFTFSANPKSQWPRRPFATGQQLRGERTDGASLSHDLMSKGILPAQVVAHAVSLPLSEQDCRKHIDGLQWRIKMTVSSTGNVKCADTRASCGLRRRRSKPGQARPPRYRAVASRWLSH